MKELTLDESEKYYEIVRKGNMDDMFNWAYQLGVADGEGYEKMSSGIRESKVQ